jgi:hypothetical protein
MPAPRGACGTRREIEGARRTQARQATSEGEMTMVMAFHSNDRRRPMLIAAALLLVILGAGLALALR